MTISKALLKYGYSNFSLEILEYCNKEDVLLREQYYLDLLKPEYNILKIAGNSFGYKHSPEVLKKMSDAKRGSNHNLYGKNHSEETRRKMSASRGVSPIFLISVENSTLLKIFSSSRAAGEYFNCCNKTILRYAKSGKVFKDKYILSFKELPVKS